MDSGWPARESNRSETRRTTGEPAPDELEQAGLGRGQLAVECGPAAQEFGRCHAALLIGGQSDQVRTPTGTQSKTVEEEIRGLIGSSKLQVNDLAHPQRADGHHDKRPGSPKTTKHWRSSPKNWRQGSNPFPELGPLQQPSSPAPTPTTAASVQRLPSPHSEASRHARPPPATRPGTDSTGQETVS